MKVLFVATVVKTHIMEFHIPYLKMIKEMGWDTAVAARNDYDIPDCCNIPYCDNYYDIPFERNPLKLGNIKAFTKLKKIIDEGNYDIIHCHTPVGSVITRLASQKARKRGCKVIYTVHGFHFYHGAPLINWIIYYPIEKYLAKKTDVLITITKEDYKRAKKFKAKRVEYIPGVGIDLNRFKKRNPKIAAQLKADLGIPSSATVLLSVGEVNTNKNHRLIIQALPDFPNAWFVLCGQGPLVEDYRKLADSLGVGNRVIMAGYRTDVENFYCMADIFVFPSMREGLPVALMEAMATETVCVASKNRGTDDLLKGSKLLFSAKSVKELEEKLKIAIHDDCSDEVIRNNYHLKAFDLSNTLNSMKKIYQQELSL